MENNFGESFGHEFGEKRDSNNRNLKKDLYTHKLKLGKRTYFFDVKENADGSKYMVITESKTQKDMTFRRDRIMVYSEYLMEFAENFNKVFGDIKDLIK